MKNKTNFVKDDQCHFCGLSFCKECSQKDIKKTRIFLCGNGQDKGKICRLCDAKHILR